MAATDAVPVGRKVDKVVRDALLAALRQSPEKLKLAAEKAWDRAVEGDLATFREIADRLDGKPTQQVTVGNVENEPFKTSLTVEFINKVAAITE